MIKDLIKGLIEYFEATPEDVLAQDLAEWERLSTFDPDARLLIQANSAEMESCRHAFDNLIEEGKGGLQEISCEPTCFLAA